MVSFAETIENVNYCAGFFRHSFPMAGFVILNFSPDNIGYIEPLTLTMFCVYEEPAGCPAPRKRV